MHTDNLFYQLFRRWPALALDLAGLDPSAAGYVFRSEELKQTAFRVDGILAPPAASDSQGLSQGEALMLRRLLARRFGPLPGWAEQRLNQATASQLEHWADQLLEVSSLDALFSDSEPQRATAAGLAAKA